MSPGTACSLGRPLQESDMPDAAIARGAAGAVADGFNGLQAWPELAPHQALPGPSAQCLLASAGDSGGAAGHGTNQVLSGRTDRRRREA